MQGQSPLRVHPVCRPQKPLCNQDDPEEVWLSRLISAGCVRPQADQAGLAVTRPVPECCGGQCQCQSGVWVPLLPPDMGADSHSVNQEVSQLKRPQLSSPELNLCSMWRPGPRLSGVCVPFLEAAEGQSRSGTEKVRGLD